MWERTMPDPAVERWKQRGCLYVWRYPDRSRNREGWHLHVDAEGSLGLCELIDLMLASPYRNQKCLECVPARPLPINPRAHWSAVSALVLTYPKDRVEDDYWQAGQDGNSLLLTLGRSKLEQLRTAISGIPNGRDDHAIGPTVDMQRTADRDRWSNECLWFWSASPRNHE